MKHQSRTYVTQTLAEHHRILKEGNVFKRDVTRMLSYMKRFRFALTVQPTSDEDRKEERKEGRKEKKHKVRNEQKRTKEQKEQNAHNTTERMRRLKDGKGKRKTRSEVHKMVHNALLRLEDWSQRAYSIMDQQMKDVSHLYIATMQHNSHLNNVCAAGSMPWLL